MTSENTLMVEARPDTASSLPVLPLKNSVLFPHLFMPLSFGRPTSMAAVEAVLATEEKTFLAVALKNPEVEQPTIGDLYTVGTRAVIKKMARSGAGIELLVQGMERVSLVGLEQTEPYLKAQVRPLPLPVDEGTEVEALRRAVLGLTARALELAHPEGGFDIDQLAAQAPDPLILAFLVGSMMSLDVVKEQALLEASTRAGALQLIHGYLAQELQVLELRQKITSQAQNEMGKEQREYLLRQQLRAIQGELGETNPERAEVVELRGRLIDADLPEAVHKEFERELGRMERMPPAAPDYQITRTYLELVLELPWRKSTEDDLDLDKAQRVLDEDHFDLEKIKERILEHLAVLKLNPRAKAPILCFVGPPGVGKTSLGQSIARSLGRQFERMSLGGLHDESELRGHRRTYIGAMPGRIIQAIRRAGVNNPVLMLDEIDKLGRDFRGDPTAALLEVLDPAQNSTFRDNYVDMPFDLSKVFFIATANALDIMPPALLDRMEVLRLSGYSEEEKLQIAMRYLVPRQLAQAGLSPIQLTISAEAVRRIITGYTREAGVRDVERMLARVARKVARKVAQGETQPIVVGRGEPDGDARAPAFLPRAGTRDPRARSCDRARLDRGWRRCALRGGQPFARHAGPALNGPARCGDARVGAGGPDLRLVARPQAGRQPEEVPSGRASYPRPRRCCPQGRPLGRRDDGDCLDIALHRPARTQPHRHDRRDHPDRFGAARRRHQGKDAGSPPGRYPSRHYSQSQRERPQRAA